MKQNFFTIAIDTCNHEEWIEKCILSCLNQKYENYEIILLDAASTDKTFDIINTYSDKVKIFQNEIRLPQVANFIELAKLAKSKSIIVSVDGDDWLKDDNVLETLNKTYNSGDVWMTYGSYEEYPHLHSISKNYYEYPDSVIYNNSYREFQWLASHLRTFRKELILKIDTQDLKTINGEWLDTTGDQAIMLPMLEMSGKRSRFIKDILYVYNKANLSSDTNINEARQIELANYIRQKNKYNLLDKI